MSGSPSSPTRRYYLASAATALGIFAAGCAGLDSNSSETSGTTEHHSSKTELTTTGSPTGKNTDSETLAEKQTTAMPDRNRTRYPLVQQPTDGQALSARTVVLSSENWRRRVSVSNLDSRTVEFLDETDFESSYVIGFEVEVTEWGYHLRLEGIEKRSKSIQIRYSDVFVEGGPNVAQTRTMLIRLPRRDGVPEAVELKRTDSDD